MVVDGTAVLFGFLFLADLTAWFQAPSVWRIISMTLIYFVFCIAVYLIRKLESESPPGIVPQWLLKREAMAVLAVLFSLTLAVLMLDQMGYWDSIFVVDDRKLGAGESSALFVYAPGAFIATALFYVLVLSGQVRETILRQSRRYAPLALMGLLGVNGMLLLLTAVLHSLNLAWWLTLPALLLLFAPPRIWVLAKRPSAFPLITFLLLIVVYTWL